ncbi:unnamed protein product [Auanema sp. JU1783]|nr:unnamed protein product [Auanema sp. JU1783]
MFNIIQSIIILSVVYISILSARDIEQETTAIEKSYNRANIFVKLRSANGRMILLMCRKSIGCQKLRKTIPQWIKEYNNEKNYSNSELIHYYYYPNLGKKLDILNETINSQEPVLSYVLASKPYIFTGDVYSQQSVLSWIVEMDKYHLIEPSNIEDAKQLLDTDGLESNCTRKFIVFMNNRKKCPSDDWPIIARLASREHNITAVYMQSPLPADILVALFKRMPELDSSSCQNMFLITQESYSVQLTDHSAEEMSLVIDQLLSGNNQSCSALLDSFWYPILPPLSELQIQYFSEEHLLMELEHKISYVLIGVAGGCAVCTLAFSIFWGLNGGAFAK